MTREELLKKEGFVTQLHVGKALYYSRSSVSSLRNMLNTPLFLEVYTYNTRKEVSGSTYKTVGYLRCFHINPYQVDCFNLIKYSNNEKNREESQ